MKKILTFAAATLLAGGAHAADLGNGLGDLEERVAELEATTASKGNRKMSLTVYGHVSKSMLWADNGIGYAGVQDNPNSASRFGFTGSAKISPNVSVGYTLEVGVGNTALDIAGSSNAAELNIRHSYWWIENKSIGRMSLGHTSDVMDGIGQIAAANTAVVALMSTGLDGVRRDVVRFDSASIGGFIVSASYADNKDYGVTLRYANTVGDFNLAAGVGYGYTEAIDLGRVLGSASAKHNPSGLFVTAALGKYDIAGATTQWQVQGGIEKNFFGLGNTTVFAEYADELMGLQWGAIAAKSFVGVGIVQTVDSVATDFFASARQFTDYSDTKGAAVLIGARVKF